MKQRTSIHLALVMAILLLAAWAADRSLASSPTRPDWTPRRHIPYYDDDSEAPFMVTDGAGTVHAFNSKNIQGNIVIIYSTWSLETGWTEPVDILLSPRKNIARIIGAHLDDEGFFHVAFFGGDEQGADIFYARALASAAHDATSWSEPEPVGPDALSPASGSVAGVGDHVFIVYSGQREGNGVYTVQSADGGDTWSDPAVVFLAYSSLLWPSHFNRAIDENGALHVVWSVGDTSGNGVAVYYARLEPAYEQWETATLLAVNEGFEADWPSITPYHGELIVIYQNRSPATRWMRRSTDGGKTWTDPVRPFPHVGSYGAASLVVDSADNLHMFLGNRIGNPSTNGMWHSVWEGDRWSPLAAVVSGPPNKDPENAFDPDNPQAIMVKGNILLLTWINDPGLDGVWYSYAVLDTPQETGFPLPSPTPSVQPTMTAVPPTATPSIMLAATLTPTTLDLSADAGESATPAGPADSLLLGVAPVALILLLIVGFANVQRLRRI